MEASLENRDLNQESYQRQSDGTQYNQHMNNEKYSMQQMQQQQQQGNMEDDDDDESYEEYEIEELPLWKKIVNELRVPVLIFVCIALIMPNSNNKYILCKIPFLGNEFNELTTLGFLLKALLCSILSYILVRFIRF